MMSSSTCIAKLLYCTDTDTHRTAKFKTNTDTGISIGASAVLILVWQWKRDFQRNCSLYHIRQMIKKRLLNSTFVSVCRANSQKTHLCGAHLGLPHVMIKQIDIIPSLSSPLTMQHRHFLL